MKNLKLLLLVATLFITTELFSQIFVGGIVMPEQQYILVNIYTSRKYAEAYVDFGSNTLKCAQITNADGEVMEFASSASILNYLYANGYTFIEVSGDDLLFERRRQL